MSKTKKIIVLTILFSIAVITPICISFAIRTGGFQYWDKEVGDFQVRFYSDYCAIKGTTEQGNSKKYLVIPEYIDEVPLVYLGVEHLNILGLDIMQPNIESDKIEKVYFESDIFAHPNSLSDCNNLKKVIFLHGKEGVLSSGGVRKFCYPYKIFKRDYSHIENYYDNAFYKIPANVSYEYNYENAPNEGYFWIDDYNYGGKIEYIPKAPQREGYKFGGWYKEAECINKWDFAADTLPEQKTEIKENKDGEEEEMTVYQETILYAKWI